ncbi:MAG: hypothetical protein ACI8TX_001458 [Hyphomicrobiaceae bacterium]|jgi:hypothetical protein
MSRAPRLLGFFLALVGSAAAFACSNPTTDAAGDSFSETLALAAATIARAVSAESSSYVDAAYLYASALEQLGDAPPDRQVGPFTVAQLRVHADSMRDRAAAERSMDSCASWVILRIPQPSARVRLGAELSAALSNIDRSEEANELLVRARQDLSAIGDDYDRAMARSLLVPAWQRAGVSKESLSELGAIGDKDPLARVLALLGRGQALRNTGANEEADASLGEAHDVVQSMDRTKRDYAWALGELAAGYAGVDRSVETRRVLGELAGARERIRALVLVADAYTRNGNGGAADYWLAEALQETTKTRSSYELATGLAETAGGFARRGDGERAQTLLGQALEVARKLDVLGSERAGALSKIARKYASMGDSKSALMIADVLLSDGSSDQAWARAGVALALAERGDFDSAIPVVFAIAKRDVRRVTLAGVLVSHVSASGLASPADAFVLHRILEEFG